MTNIVIKSLTQPDIRPVKESGELYRLEQDYTFTFSLDGKKYSPTIKRGFQYDGASVPRPVWTMIGFLPDGIHRPAALIHDYLYQFEGQIVADGKVFNYSRKFTDQLFLKALEYVGVKSWHARIAYLAARVGGALYWRDN